MTNTLVVSDQQALVVALMEALEGGAHGPELARFFHPDVSQIEYPSLIDPRLMHHDQAATSPYRSCASLRVMRT